MILLTAFSPHLASPPVGERTGLVEKLKRKGMDPHLFSPSAGGERKGEGLNARAVRVVYESYVLVRLFSRIAF